MSVGAKVFNADGSLQFDSATHLSRVLGIVAVPAGASGSVTVPADATGTIWWVILPTDGSWYMPGTSLSGRTLSWGPSSLYTPATDATLIYGVY